MLHSQYFEGSAFSSSQDRQYESSMQFEQLFLHFMQSFIPKSEVLFQYPAMQVHLLLIIIVFKATHFKHFPFLSHFLHWGSHNEHIFVSSKEEMLKYPELHSVQFLEFLQVRHSSKHLTQNESLLELSK